MQKKFEVIQNSGEIIFVPSGWHHQVQNMVISQKLFFANINGIKLEACQHFTLVCNEFNTFQEDTISINHNWINGNNIQLCWKFIKNSLKDVQKQIEDCKDMDGWHQQCQVSCNLFLSVFSYFLSIFSMMSQKTMEHFYTAQAECTSTENILCLKLDNRINIIEKIICHAICYFR